MILTITTNPSVDYVYKTDSFQLGRTNRETEHHLVVGGKGINAARVASLLFNRPNLVAATGFYGNRNSEMVEDDLNYYGVQNHFVSFPGRTRYCYTIYDENGVKTELNELGSLLPANGLDLLLQKIDTVKGLTGVSINGSSAPGLSNDTYSTLIKHIRKVAPDARIILDTSGESLRESVRGTAAPDIIKPNNGELGEIVGYEVSEDANEALAALKDPALKNVPLVVVSLGENGAVIKDGIDDPQYYQVSVQKLEEVNAEGSGDSVVGGMLYGIERGFSDVDIIRYGMAAGMANVIEKKTGYVNRLKVEELVNDPEMIQIMQVDER